MCNAIKHLLAIVCASFFVFPTFSARGQEKTRIAWAALNPAASPMWVVQEKGLLRKLGIDAEIIGINSSPIAMQALLAGDLDVIVTSVTTLVHSLGRRRHDHGANIGADVRRSHRERAVDH